MSMFNHSKSVTISGGTFIQHIAPSVSLAAFERLQNAVAPGAFHNSGERFDPPKCHPRTRRAVIERIMNWIHGKESTESLIMWLNGAAGAGKSAIAQTIAELCHAEGILLASFFFSRSDFRRSDATYLFPTLAYQIARAIPEARSQLEQTIARDPLVLTLSLEAQMLALVIEPLQSVVASGYFEDPTSPRLIIIDGLDEVLHQRAQSRILEVIADCLHHHCMPLIFLISSRPEQQIMFAFSSESLSQLTNRLRLDDTFHPDDDIRRFLNDSLSKIKETHPRKSLIPSSWPPADVMDTLVRKASGQFVYAATVVRFVESIRHRPTDRLEIVLGLRPVQRDMPFAELDALYKHILSTLQDPEKTLLIIGTLLVGGHYYSDNIAFTSEIEWFLGLDAGDAELLLADIFSLISLEDIDNGQCRIRMLHASFGDFLFDPSRSGQFAIDQKNMYTTIACNCFRHLKLRMHLEDRDRNLSHYQFLLSSIPYYMPKANITPELLDHLTGLSMECLLEDICLCILKFKDYDQPTVILELSRMFWFDFVPVFLATIQTLALPESESHMLQSRNYDQIVKRELDVYYARQPLYPFLHCLICETAWEKRRVLSQLIDWNYHQAMAYMPGRFDLIRLLFLEKDSDCFKMFCEFLRDASRSGKYAVNAQMYANASLSCLKYLFCRRLGVPIDLHHTRRNVALRRNSPWKWRQHRKYLDSLRVRSLNTIKISLQLLQRECFPKLYVKRTTLSTYTGATLLGLTFLPGALNQSAKSDELITLCSAEKLFSQRALLFPDKVEHCKIAIAAYLARIGDETNGEAGGV